MITNGQIHKYILYWSSTEHKSHSSEEVYFH